MKNNIKTIISLLLGMSLLTGCTNKNVQNKVNTNTVPQKEVSEVVVKSEVDDKGRYALDMCAKIEKQINLPHVEVNSLLDNKDDNYIMYSIHGNDEIIKRMDTIKNIILTTDTKHTKIELAIIRSDSECLYDKYIK